MTAFAEDRARRWEPFGVTEADFADWQQPKGRSGGLVGSRPSGQSQARNGQPAPAASGAGEAPAGQSD